MTLCDILSDDSEIEHNCGVVVAHTLHDCWSMMNDLQHRGREGAGIAAVGDVDPNNLCTFCIGGSRPF